MTKNALAKVDFIGVIQPKNMVSSGGSECFASSVEPRKTSFSSQQLSSQGLFAQRRFA
jgi:hypothetical protein